MLKPTDKYIGVPLEKKRKKKKESENKEEKEKITKLIYLTPEEAEILKKRGWSITSLVKQCLHARAIKYEW